MGRLSYGTLALAAKAKKKKERSGDKEAKVEEDTKTGAVIVVFSTAKGKEGKR